MSAAARIASRLVPSRRPTRTAAAAGLALLLALGWGLAPAGARQDAPAPDPRGDALRKLQDHYVVTRDRAEPRAYHFGSQGPGGVFSNHTSHSNRLIPVYVYGTKADLGAVTGANSRYRNADTLIPLYGRLPENTVNPTAEYADQADLYRVQREAVQRGAKYVFTVWFDGMDYDTTRAAALARTGRDYAEGPGSGLVFQDYTGTPLQYGYVVTSPTHDANEVDVDRQLVRIPPTSLPGGYDARFAGATPWARPALDAPGYLRGQGMTKDELGVLRSLGGLPHAYTDSSSSAGEYASGVKSYNNGVNVAEDGRFVPTLYNQLQEQGWKVGTVTSVAFPHASPAAMYAHNVHRDDYQDLARDMLGLVSIAQQTGKEARHPGLDVVLGAGFAQVPSDSGLKGQGQNAVKGENLYIAEADQAAIAVERGGAYVVVERTPEEEGAKVLDAAAARAAAGRHKLFGLFGAVGGHLPYRTAEGDHKPARGIKRTSEAYSPEDLLENPTLADMTRAALTVLTAEPGKPFALFVEAGDVDFGLHDNNLDNAIGAVYSGEAAIEVIFQWVEQHSNWDESVVIITSDHGHYLVIDDPKGLAGLARPR